MKLRDVGAKLMTIGATSYYVRRREGRKTILDPIEVLAITRTPWERKGKKVSHPKLLPTKFISYFEAQRYLSYYIPVPTES